MVGWPKFNLKYGTKLSKMVNVVGPKLKSVTNVLKSDLFEEHCTASFTYLHEYSQDIIIMTLFSYRLWKKKKDDKEARGEG